MLSKESQKAVQKIHRAHEKRGKEERYARYVDAVKRIKPLAKKVRTGVNGAPVKKAIRYDDTRIAIANDIEINTKERGLLQNAIKKMVPWRKGPFTLCGEQINSEWQSDLKWDRVKKACGSLQGKSILDIGCNNGYYLFHIARQNPKYLLGIDPVIPYYLQFQLLNQFYPLPNTEFKLMGVEDLHHLEKTFDVIFCMGILYHHTDPIGILKKVYNCLKPGGLIIIESQGINKEGPYFLMPQKQYLGTPGNWFIPSKEALMNMVRRSGLQYVDCFYETKLDSSEQSKSEHAPYDSLQSGLDENDSTKTVEGYPAPWRFYIKARKARIRR